MIVNRRSHVPTNKRNISGKPEFKWLEPFQQVTHENYNKTDVERRQTLGHPGSINPNMINHIPQQSPLIF